MTVVKFKGPARPSTIAELQDAMAARFEAEHGEVWNRTLTIESALAEFDNFGRAVSRTWTAAATMFDTGSARVLAQTALTTHDFFNGADCILLLAGNALLHGAGPRELSRLRELRHRRQAQRRRTVWI